MIAKCQNYLQKMVVCALMLLATHAYTRESGEVQLQFLTDDENSEVRELLIESAVLDDSVKFINEIFLLDQNIDVVVGASDGPLYDPSISEIQIPYSFYEEVVERFEQIETDPAEVALFANDAMLHTLFHEIGHALVDQFNLPVVGREEDAVDALANVLLLEYYENGAEMAVNAAQLFALESEDRGDFEEADFWDEHSLDEQRYYSTLCHVYGSDPAAHKTLPEEIGFSDERADFCVASYQQLVDDWNTLLESVFR